MIIRPATTADFPAVLALNEASVHFLAPMDHSRLLGLNAGSSPIPRASRAGTCPRLEIWC